MWLLDNLALAPGVLFNRSLSLVNVSHLVHLGPCGLHLSGLCDDLLSVNLNLRRSLLRDSSELLNFVFESLLFLLLLLLFDFLYLFNGF